MDFSISLPQNRFGSLNNVLNRESELLEQILCWSRGAERGHANDRAFGSYVALPAKYGSGFNRYSRFHFSRQNGLLIALLLHIEDAGRGHTDHARANALDGQLLVGSDAER